MMNLKGNPFEMRSISFYILIASVLLSFLHYIGILGYFFYTFIGIIVCIVLEAFIIVHYLSTEDVILESDESEILNDSQNQQFPTKLDVSSINAANIRLEGVLCIQMVGKKKRKALYHCELINSVLFFTKKKLHQFDKSHKYERYKMILNGAEIRRVGENEIKGMKHAIEIIHPLRKIVYKVDYLYLIAESEIDAERWYYALLNICDPYNGKMDFEKNLKLHQPFELYCRKSENVKWVNALLARFYENIRISQKVRTKLIKKIAVRLGEKIEEKNLQNYLSNIEIIGLDIGTKAPYIKTAMLLPLDRSGDMITDLDIMYSDGDAKMSMSAKVNVKKFSFNLKIQATLKSLQGRMQVRCPPYPAERYSICFYKEPDMTMEVNVHFGNAEKASTIKNMIQPKIAAMIESRLKDALIERFVYPHRKYFRIPSTVDSDPPPLNESSIFIKTEFSEQEMESY